MLATLFSCLHKSKNVELTYLYSVFVKLSFDVHVLWMCLADVLGNALLKMLLNKKHKKACCS